MDEGVANVRVKDSADVGARVVVLAGSRGEVPSGLLSVVAERGATTAVVADPPGVMVELARAPAEAVVIVDPERQPMLGELVAALRAYYPATRCEMYAGDPALRGLRDGREDVEVESGEVASRGASVLRRLRERIEPLTVKLPADVSQSPASPLITQEELAMLLGSAEQDGELVAEGESKAK